MARIRDQDACPGALQVHRAADGALVRIRLPGGGLTSAQLDALAHTADDIAAAAEGAMQLIGFPAREPMMRRHEPMEDLKRPAHHQEALDRVLAEIKKLRDSYSH